MGQNLGTLWSRFRFVILSFFLSFSLSLSVSFFFFFFFLFFYFLFVDTERRERRVFPQRFLATAATIAASVLAATRKPGENAQGMRRPYVRFLVGLLIWAAWAWRFRQGISPPQLTKLQDIVNSLLATATSSASATLAAAGAASSALTATTAST